MSDKSPYTAAMISQDVHHYAATLTGEADTFWSESLIGRWYVYRDLYRTLAALTDECRNIGRDIIEFRWEIGLPSWEYMITPDSVRNEEEMKQEAARVLRVLKEWGVKHGVDTCTGRVLQEV